MANTKQARKRIRQSAKHYQHNVSLRSMYRTYIKKVLSAIESKNKTEAASALQAAIPVLDKMATKGIIHKNKAARHKSKLCAKVKALS